MSTDEPGGTPANRASQPPWRLRVRELPGSVTPRSRLPITPEHFKGRLRRPTLGMPLAKPTWPGTIPKPPEKPTLGAAYDTDWARRYPARVARLLLNEAVNRPAVRLLADPQVEGLDRVAHVRGPVIFAPNHSSHLDTPVLMSVIPERWRNRMVVASAADYFFDTRLRAAAFALAMGAIPMERQRVSREGATQAAALVADGWSLLIFPEGGRSRDGWGQAHLPGTAWLAERTGRPVIPVHIDGTRQILARGATKLRPGTARVTFGHPLLPAGDTRRARDLAGRIEASVAALADEGTTDWWRARQRAASGHTPSLRGPDAASWRRSWALGVERERRRRRTWPK